MDIKGIITIILSSALIIGVTYSYSNAQSAIENSGTATPAEQPEDSNVDEAEAIENEEPLTEKLAQEICEEYATEEQVPANEKEAYLSSCVTELMASESPLTEESARETCKKYAVEEEVPANEEEAYLSSCVTELMADESNQDEGEIVSEEIAEEPVLEEKDAETNAEQAETQSK